MTKITQTIVFEFDDYEQRHALLDRFEAMLQSDDCPRISGLSNNDELTRAQLMIEALDRYDDHYDLRYAMEVLAKATDLQNWSWEKYEAEEG